jgi:hypothetical protein
MSRTVSIIQTFVCCTVFMTVTMSQAAHAQRTETQRIADAAHEAYAEGNFAEAVVMYRQAYEMDPHPVLQFNLARTLEATGDLPAARNSYRMVVENTEIEEVRSIANDRLSYVLDTLERAGFPPETVTSERYLTTQYLTIESAGEPVDVYVDGVGIGTTPITEHPIRPGPHEFFFTNETGIPEVRDVVITEDGPERLTVELDSRENFDGYIPPPPGRLRVIGPVAGMEVLIDGGPIDRETPISGWVLPAGTYTIRLRHPFYHSASEVVDIEPGEESVVNLTDKMVKYRDVLPLRRHQRIGNILMPVGAAIIVAGATTGALALRDSNRYDDNPSSPDRRTWYDRAQREALATDILLPVGVATLTTGLIMRAVRGKDEPDNDARGFRQDLFRFSISPSRDGIRLGFRSSF